VTPERWQQVKKVLAAALECPPEERAGYLDQSCTDPLLRREVESLIAAHEQVDSNSIKQPAVEDNALKSGTKLGSYEILALVGSGGMGEVYKAHDTKLGRDVAIKILPQASAHNSETVVRFQREAKMLASLNHPNIATIYGLEQSNGTSYLVMELVSGETLAERIKREGAVPVEEALKISVQIAEALEAAHEKGIIHRDLKPANVKLTPEGTVKLLDFGLAKALLADATREAGATTEGAILGTAAYMSPEQARGKQIDKRTDVWAFGCLIYELITGQQAFVGETIQDTIAAVLERDPDWQVLARAGPEKVCYLVRRCLEKQKDRRLRDLSEARVEIDEVLAAHRKAMRRWFPRFLSSRKRVVFAVCFLTVVGMAVALIFHSWREHLFGQSVTPHIASLAVLPLVNLSGDPGQDYFADGMTDALITDLSRIGALRVISRTSVMQYKQARKPMPQIAKELDVEAVMEGSVQRSGHRVRITAQLIDGPTDRHLWVETYERSLGDVLNLESDVAQAIAREINVVVTPQEHTRLARVHVVNPDAHDDYLKGRFFWNKRTPEGFDKALNFFQQAIEKDQAYAQAYAGLADTYTLMQDYGLLSPDAYPRARMAALKALELDETMAEAHTSLAAVMESYDWDWSGAEQEYKRAIELNPGYETAHQWYSVLLSTLGRHEEALSHAQKARELAPLSARVNIDLGWAFYWSGLYDRATDVSRNTLGLDPNFAPAHTLLGWADVRTGAYHEAISEFRKALDLSGEVTGNNVAIAYSQALAGQKNDALAAVQRLQSHSTSGTESFYHVALIYIGLGEQTLALDNLEKSFVGEHEKWLGFIKIDPSFEALHSAERFKRLLLRMNLAG
jgi:serine/threonine protein kinase/TolB-like protein/tetratricopeptide (TPR) repeat protein